METRRERVLKHFIDQADYMNERVANGIEQHRKGRFSIAVKDEEGNAISGTQIAIHQKKHEFHLGVNPFALEEMETPEKAEEYKKV